MFRGEMSFVLLDIADFFTQHIKKFPFSASVHGEGQQFPLKLSLLPQLDYK